MKLSTISELFEVVNQFASKSSELVLESVTLDVLELARLCLQFNGDHFQQHKKRVSKTLARPMCVRFNANTQLRNNLLYHYT